MEVSSSSMKVARVTVRAMTQGLMGLRATARGSALARSEMVAVGDIFKIETHRSLFLDAGTPKRNRKVANIFEEIVQGRGGPRRRGGGVQEFLGGEWFGVGGLGVWSGGSVGVWGGRGA